MEPASSVAQETTRRDRFDRGLKDFLAEIHLDQFAEAFSTEYAVRSCQDLTLLSRDELQTILSPDEAEHLRAHLKKKDIQCIAPQDLVGEWVDIEGMGPGLIRAYNKVTMNLLYDSFHRVDFSISGGGAMESVLLRRRKLLRWNKGARFHILPGKPSHEELLQALADEEHAAKQTLEHQRQHSMNGQQQQQQRQSRLHIPPASPPQNNNNDNSNASGAPQDDAASTAAAVAAAAERVYATVASVAAGRTSPSSQPSSPMQAHHQEDSTEALAALLPFWSEQLPEPWEFGELDFDLRRVAKVLGPRNTFVHVAHRLSHRFKYLRPSENALKVGVEGGPTTTSSADDALAAPSQQQQQQPQRRRSSLRATLKGEYMCDASTFGRWAEAVADSYSEANPYHNALHAADVMLTASAYLDHSGVLGPPLPGDPHRIGSGPSLRWWWHRYALLLAAAAHDVGHPARMNPFVVATKRHLALHYDVDAGGVAHGGDDDGSSSSGGASGGSDGAHGLRVLPPEKGGVLEAMHASTFLALTRQHNVLEHLGGGAAEARLRETVVELILATDLGMQGSLLAQWSARCAVSPREGGMDVAGLLQNQNTSGVSTGTTTTTSTTTTAVSGGSSGVVAPAATTSTTSSTAIAAAASDDRKLFLKMVLKAADVSNPAKPLPLYLHWTERILDEFYAQGDEEKALGLPVTAMPQCDRRGPAVAPGQKGFIGFVVRPVFAALVAYSDRVLDAQFANQQQQQESKSSAVADGSSDASSSDKSSSRTINGVQHEASSTRYDDDAAADATSSTLSAKHQRPWPGLRAPLEHLDSNLAFWKECEAALPPEAWASVCVPSDLPLAELAPDAMAAEVAALQAALESEANGSGGNYDGGDVATDGGHSIVVDAAAGSEERPQNISLGGADSSSGDGGSGSNGDDSSAHMRIDGGGEEAEIVKGLRSENEALAEKLRQAEELIAKLQSPSKEPPQPTTQQEELQQQKEQSSEPAPVESEDGTAAPPPAAGPDGSTNVENSSEPEVVGRVRSPSTIAAAEAHEVGARIRALQATIAAQGAVDPNAASRFLHQPRGHRLEPMVGVDNMMRPTAAGGATGASSAGGDGSNNPSSNADPGGGGGGGMFASPVSRASMSQVQSTNNSAKKTTADGSASPMAFRATDGSMLASSKAAADAIRAAAKGGSPP